MWSRKCPSPASAEARPAGASAMDRAASAFDFQVTAIDGSALPLSRFRGKVLLLVNVASRCGYTPQYAGLQDLWQRHRDDGLVVIGFPCNQFGHQEPGSEAQIADFCSAGHGVDFPLTAKVRVNGTGAHPLWTWLKRQRSGAFGIDAIKWNFSKFLVGRDGQVIARYAPGDAPQSFEDDIRAALAAP